MSSEHHNHKGEIYRIPKQKKLNVYKMEWNSVEIKNPKNKHEITQSKMITIQAFELSITLTTEAFHLKKLTKLTFLFCCFFL